MSSDSEKTITLNDKSYTWTKSGWIETKTRLLVDIPTARKLDKLSARENSKDFSETSNIDLLLEQAANAHENKQLILAEHLVRRAIRLKPDHIGSYAMLCSILRDKGCPKQALEETERVRTLKDAPLLTSRAAAYCDLEQWEAAAKEIAIVLARGGNNHAFNVAQRIKKAMPELYEKG